MEALATPNFHTATDSTFVHDVPTLWIDNLTSDNMTVCVYIAGRGERHATDQVSFTWFVYQGAPDGALGGVVNTETWLTGTTCTQVNLAMTFDSPPNVLATLRHSVPGVRRDAATLWTKDVGTQSFSLCVRELQNFDGAHENVSIVRGWRRELAIILCIFLELACSTDARAACFFGGLFRFWFG